jgi:hypothetical protein
LLWEKQTRTIRVAAKGVQLLVMPGAPAAANAAAAAASAVLADNDVVVAVHAFFRTQNSNVDHFSVRSET